LISKYPKRQYKRSARFNRLLQEEIADIISTRLKDPRIGFVSITRVESTGDLRSSKVYVSVLDEAQATETIKVLDGASGMIRAELLQRIHARRVPEIRFVLDRTISYSIHISGVLDQLKIDDSEEEQ
jgi:ribosome-binding factor A